MTTRHRACLLHCPKSRLESIDCPAQGELAVDAEMTGQIDDREQDIAQLRLGLGWIGEDRLELVDLFSDLGQDPGCLRPVEPHLGRPVLDLRGALDGGQRPRDPVHLRLPPGAPLLVLDLIPVPLHVCGRIDVDLAEDMWMPTHQLLPHDLCHVVDVEDAVLPGDGCVEEDREQDIPQLVLDRGIADPVGPVGVEFPNRVHQLVGLFDQILDQGLMGLFAVPGALIAQNRHGPHRADETSRIGVDEHRRPVSGQSRVDFVGRRLEPDGIGGAQTCQHQDPGLLGEDPADPCGDIGQDLGTVELGDDGRFVQYQRLRQVVTIEDLQTPIQRVVSQPRRGLRR